MSSTNFPLCPDQISSFCRKWQVREFSLFGSVLRDDFGPDSDVDVLVSFQEGARITLWDMSDMVAELENLFGRKVDLVEKEGLRNPYRRKEILSNCEVVYAA
jgi:uncharacterized protein